MITSIGKHTIRKLRRLYSDTWHHEWPEDNAYLLLLWQEARTNNNCNNSRYVPPAVWAETLILMRESHCFEPQEGLSQNLESTP